MARVRPLHLTKAALRVLVYAIAAVLVVVAVGIAAVETGWVKNQIRHLIISQANNYLTAQLDIGKLEGSVFRGLKLSHVTVSQEGETIISVDEVSLSYSIRELFEPGLIIRAIRLVHPHVVAARLPDGRWNLGALVRRERRQQQRSGPGRPLHVLSIDVADGDIELRDPLTFGAVHVPSRFAQLNASFTYDYEPVTSILHFSNVSWSGGDTELSVEHLAGGLSNGPSGWLFDNLQVRTPESEFTLNGRVNRETKPTQLDLHAVARRFAFQEWAGLLGALRNIAVESAFDITLAGPTTKLATDVTMNGNAGDVQMSILLDTSVPGWHGTGQATVAKLNLARWFNREDRQSDITGHVTFDLDLDLGHHFPRGSYAFAGQHAAYIGYEIFNMNARGTLTQTDALISDMTGDAYGSQLHLTSGSIGIDAPYAYHFAGSTKAMDLRRLPRDVPITHVESQLDLDTFDVTGQFAAPLFIKGGAQFGDSEYLGAQIGAGASGTIDTSVTPARYSGDGEISLLDIGRFGDALDVGWMKDPRWSGVVSGHFHVAGAGSGGETMTLDAGGTLERADMFGGALDDATVTVHIAEGSLSGSYNGRIDRIDASRAFADPRFAATLTGHADATMSVRGVMARTTTIDDYDTSGRLEVEKSVVRGIPIDRGSVEGTLAGATLTIKHLDITGPIDATGSGTIEFDGETPTNFSYQIGSGDLSLLNERFGRTLYGTITTNGSLTGPLNSAQVAGEASVDNLDVDGASVLSITAQYTATVPWDAPERASARVTGSATEIYAASREIPSVVGTLTYDDHDLTADLHAAPLWIGAPRLLNSIAVQASGRLDAASRTLAMSTLQVGIGDAERWQMTNGSASPTISWASGAIALTPLQISDAVNGGGTVTVAGSWKKDGPVAARITADRVFLDPFTSERGRPARYGGVLTADATLSGTQSHPVAHAQFAVVDGRVRRLGYERLAGRIDYDSGIIAIDARLDQTAGVWLTAKGTVPIAFTASANQNAPVDLQIASSRIGLGLIEGITDVVHDVAGDMQVNVGVTGTLHEPHLTGTVDLSNATFVVSATGEKYKNGRAAFDLASDQLHVSSFHLEDRNGRALEVIGSIGTRALTVGDIHIDAISRRFEVLHNDTGTVDVDATLQLRGDLQTPRISGDVTILNGDLKVDRILEQTLYQPYSTTAATGVATAADLLGPEGAPIDAIAALNPWQRLALDLSVHSRGSLRLTGDSVQVSQGTPLGLGSFNLRATGDLYVSKDSGGDAYVTGSFDSISGSYEFQGRRFEVEPTSSINFRGDLNPELYVTVTRVISGVETRVTISGELRQPELLLSSTPPLDASDILSLIVFNTSTSDLSATQQQDLAVRAGTLAYGFVATPLITALQHSIGLETLEIAPPSSANGVSYGPTVTVGNELVPGLVAQFTRAFGQEAYDEATIEYYISRILRIRATFSDAQSLVLRDQPFRRVERAGIDLLFFFSF